jgi:phosphopantetheine adenylyltransferase
MDLAQRKLILIEALSHTQNERLIAQIESLLKEAIQEDKLNNLIKPMRKKTDLSEIIQEKGYFPQKGKALKGQLPSDESIIDLLKLLK